MNRRSFLKLLGAAITAPFVARLPVKPIGPPYQEPTLHSEVENDSWGWAVDENDGDPYIGVAMNDAKEGEPVMLSMGKCGVFKVLCIRDVHIADYIHEWDLSLLPIETTPPIMMWSSMGAGEQT